MDSGIRHIVINEASASAANVLVNNQWVSIYGQVIGHYMDLQGGFTRKEVAITTEIPGVVTYTPTSAANSTTYGFQVVQLFPNATGAQQKRVVLDLYVTTPDTGAVTAASICEQFRAKYFDSNLEFLGSLDVTETGGAGSPLVLEANAGAPVVFASWINYGGGASTDVVNTTPGVDTQGTSADMQAVGVDSDLITGTAYTLYSFRGNPPTGQNNSMRVNQLEWVYVWINQSITNYAAIITRMDEMVAGFPAGGSTYPDPEIVALSD